MRVDHTRNIIEVSGVSFSYDGDDILRDVTLDIHAGDYAAFVGPNGAGKTTLLKIMLGILKPARGNVRLFGTDIRQFTSWEKIGYVPQKALVFDAHFPATVQEIVLMGRFAKAGLLRFMKPADRAAAHRALERVGMREHRERLIGDLSGGEQQRVFIARALATEPEILFLDEPTTGIDAASEEEFYALLRALNRDAGVTLILVTHDLDRIAREAMHIFCIDQTLTWCGTPEEYGAARDTAGAHITHRHRAQR